MKITENKLIAVIKKLIKEQIINNENKDFSLLKYMYNMFFTKQKQLAQMIFDSADENIQMSPIQDFYMKDKFNLMIKNSLQLCRRNKLTELESAIMSISTMFEKIILKIQSLRKIISSLEYNKEKYKNLVDKLKSNLLKLNNELSDNISKYYELIKNLISVSDIKDLQ